MHIQLTIHVLYTKKSTFTYNIDNTIENIKDQNQKASGVVILIS